MRIVTVVLITCLSLLLPVPSSVAAEPSGQDARQPAVKTVTRGYGDGPVRQATPDQRVRVRFEGRAGHRVRLPSLPRDGRRCERVVLRQGRDRIRPGTDGFWRLPRRGRYVFAYRPCAASAVRHRLQLVRLRVHRLPVDGPAVEMPASSRGFLGALSVRVPAVGPVVVRRVGDTAAFTQEFDPLFLEAGRRPYDLYGALPLTSPLVAGHRRLVFGVGTWQASTPVTQDQAIEGGPGLLDTGTVPGRTHELRFSGGAGEWVRLELDDADEGWRWPDVQLLGEGQGAVLQFPDRLWRLPASGRYRLLVTPSTPVAGAQAQALLTSVRELSPVTLDGTPTTFETTGPGEVLVAPVAAPTNGAAHTYAVDDVMMEGGPWSLEVTSGIQNCGRPPGPLGCPHYGPTFSDRHLDDVSGYAGSGDVAVLVPGDQTGGRLTLRVSPTGPAR